MNNQFLIKISKLYQNKNVINSAYQLLCSSSLVPRKIQQKSPAPVKIVQIVDEETSLIDAKFEKALRIKREDDGKYLRPSYNIAAYADKSPTVQEFVKLGVDFHKIEKIRGAAQVILGLDFENDAKKYIKFLHDQGVSADDLGNFFTKNPFIFKEDLDNLAVRINYLESKNFSPENISTILTKNPNWLSFSTIDIDSRLGFFQQHFSLSGDEVRLVTTKSPNLITFDLRHVEKNKFSVVEEMGFSNLEAKQLLCTVPKIYMKTQHSLLMQFQYLHNEMMVPHKIILGQPHILLSRVKRTRERFMFLKELNKIQLDPTKPHYISPLSIVENDDKTFCKEIAKVSIVLYNNFLKTL